MSADTITDPREIRKILTKMRYTGQCDFKGADRNMSFAAMLTRQVLTAAECAGFSGEDAYAMLAYHALQQLEEAQGKLLTHACITPNPWKGG